MNLIEQYESLVEQKRWDEAIPVIRRIIERSPGIDTSWFNYGVCLDELGRHDEAAEAFIQAQERNITDWGIHYRVFRSLFLAKDYKLFLHFADYSCGLNPDMIHSLCEDENFSQLFEREDFRELKSKFTRESK